MDRHRLFTTTMVTLVVIAALAMPATLGLSDASANPQPTTWGQLKGIYGTHTSVWVFLAGLATELAW